MKWLQIVMILNPSDIYVTADIYWEFNVQYAGKSHVKRDKIN